MPVSFIIDLFLRFFPSAIPELWYISVRFWWQLMDSRGMHVMPESVIQARNNPHKNKNQRGNGCLATLRRLCVPKPPQWNKMQLYLPSLRIQPL